MTRFRPSEMLAIALLAVVMVITIISTGALTRRICEAQYEKRITESVSKRGVAKIGNKYVAGFVFEWPHDPAAVQFPPYVQIAIVSPNGMKDVVAFGNPKNAPKAKKDEDEKDKPKEQPEDK